MNFKIEFKFEFKFSLQSLMKQSSLDDSMGDLDLTGEEDGNNAGSAQKNTEQTEASSSGKNLALELVSY